MKLRDNTDCPYLHDIFDQYCNLFKGYKNCDKNDCEVLKTLKENEQLKSRVEKMKNCWNCKYYKVGDTTCLKGKPHNSGGCFKDWELAE